MNLAAIPIVVFVACYGLFVYFPRHRSWIACGGSLVLLFTGALSWHEALTECVQWNVIALFFGTLILAELFMQSRMPAVIAEWFVDRTSTLRGAMLAICALSGLISIFVENVAVVLLVAPVAMSLAEKLKISPRRLIILIAMSSNLQGTATLIGDPPSMILAGHMKLTFNDFFVYQGRPGIFFAVQIGALASICVAALMLREHRQPIELIPVERTRSLVPTSLMIGLVFGLSTTSVFDPEFKWLAGTLTLCLAATGLLWYRFQAHWGSLRRLLTTLDWDTTFFLIGVFIIVGALSKAGLLEIVAAHLASAAGGHILYAFILIVAIALLVSGFVDNVPFLLAMIPVAEKMALSLDTPVPLLMFALLVGACLGGNITPIGASANVVAVGLLRKRGEPVAFREFMAVGFPFTAAAVVSACVWIWLIWAH